MPAGQRAFIVKLNLNDTSNLQAVVEDITDAVTAEGYVIISVSPWSAPTEEPSILAPPTLGGGGIGELSLPTIEPLNI